MSTLIPTSSCAIFEFVLHISHLNSTGNSDLECSLSVTGEGPRVYPGVYFIGGLVADGYVWWFFSLCGRTWDRILEVYYVSILIQ